MYYVLHKRYLSNKDCCGLTTSLFKDFREPEKSFDESEQWGGLCKCSILIRGL